MLSFTGCSDFWERMVGATYGIFARNDTSMEIQVYGTYESKDTLLPFDIPELEFFVPAERYPQYEYGNQILSSTKHWSKQLDDADTIRLFFFDKSVIDSYSWDEIHDNYLVLQRYDFSKFDLEKLNWRISYPPDERMKDIKMWPPYEEVVQE
ncbi:MAG: hypothetical protein NC115_01925 [Bacteroidales bacterium]|nr:hypothetical protein [Bacteroidales bacterium]